MRVHISIDDEIVDRIDRRGGPRERSSFIEGAVRRALDEAERLDALDAALGGLSDTGHPWDEDPATWVRAGRTRLRNAGRPTG